MSAAPKIRPSRILKQADLPDSINDHLYLLALGSNRRHAAFGAPGRVLLAAIAALREAGIGVVACSRNVDTAPLGPSQRRFANMALVARSSRSPQAMLTCLKRIEQAFGRRKRARRWSARVLDLDIILWSGGRFESPELTIPHPEFRQRHFVLAPALEIAPDWRDPVTGLTMRQLFYRFGAR